MADWEAGWVVVGWAVGKVAAASNTGAAAASPSSWSARTGMVAAGSAEETAAADCAVPAVAMAVPG